IDSINNIYRPGDSRFIDTLIEASNNKENIYIICLDEMNLARVEHYFSQILSVLELDRDDRILKLYNEELEGTIKNSNKYKANIKIGNNILLVGTVNPR
ncbi:ATPase, partial [Clostridium perfringens]